MTWDSQKLAKRIERFQSCKHRNMQTFTECCLDCGENVYTTMQEMIEQDNREKRSSEQEWFTDGMW